MPACMAICYSTKSIVHNTLLSFDSCHVIKTTHVTALIIFINDRYMYVLLLGIAFCFAYIPI